MNESQPESVFPSYGEFARSLYRTAILSDPWLEGVERFRLQGAILDESQATRLAQAAERVAYVHHELAEIVWKHPHFLDKFFNLTPFQKAMWLASSGRWHGIARVDLFICEDGRIRSCEMNSDTPSGEAEAVIVNRMLHQFHPRTIDPNQAIEDRFVRMLCESHRVGKPRSEGLSREEPRTIAIIYPTDLPEDLSMIALYREWLEKRGKRVILGSPFNIGVDPSGRIAVLGEPIDLIIRHYKTDWWGERETIWVDQPPFPDPDPLDRQLIPLLEAAEMRRVTVINPFGAVLLQNKKSMAFMWEHKDLFSRRSRAWIEDLIPETRRFTSIAEIESLNRRDWVLKSVYGCEGDSVFLGRFLKAAEWRRVIARLDPRHWILQKFFEIAPVEDGLLTNYGVFVIGGRTSGFYTRLSKAGTDYTALTAPTYISRSEELE